ncbi:hypothetical protein [Methylomonas rivi]|uniref:Uncharacterized protein n=1 Tax=Methylomonas rivi TaxID=2952226 RepID=A0ABT1U892_9GAMM|nr:hypothetical protein [Methylomonas sp. WSC-6]MCQ8129738.1 hypothetical protein [Methylomonas sp. WSC-6]
MNVSELIALTRWINREIVDTQIPQKYQTLVSLIQQHAHPNQHKPALEADKTILIESIRNVSLWQLTKDQLDLLNALGIGSAVGEFGVHSVEDILYRNVIDVATSAQKTQEILDKLNDGINKSSLIQTGLIGCVNEEKYESENEILIRVSFTGDASMSNVVDFKSWAGIWYDIGRGVAMAHNLPPEEIKIVGATKGSIVIELAVIAQIAATTSGIILAALKIAEKVLDIRKKAEELRGLKLQNDQLAIQLEHEADKEKEFGIEEITKSVITKLNLKENGEGDKVNALDKSVKNLVNFIEKGGVIDFVVPEDKEGLSEPALNIHQHLRMEFQQIRQLEKKLGLLEHKP